MTLLYLLVIPFFWCIPVSLVSAELSTAMPVEGGFYRCDGTSLEPLFDMEDRPKAGDTAIVADRLRNAARVMARLHRIEPGSVGLGGEPVVGCAEEIARWCRLLETVDPDLVPAWQDVATELRASVPAALTPAVVHGDFRLGNLLATRDRITSVIDWEIWSVGDSRVDVGWFLINADPATYGRPTPYSGFTPTSAELADVYVDALEAAVPELDWFRGLACFKSAATWSLIVKHNRRRTIPDDDLEAMAPVLPSLLARAADFLKGG